MTSKQNNSTTIDLEAGLHPNHAEQPTHITAASQSSVGGRSDRKAHIIAASHGSQSSVASRFSTTSKRSTTSTVAEEAKAGFQNLLFLVPPIVFCGLHIYYALDYDSTTSVCNDTETYTFAPGQYCFVAGVMSLAVFVICSYAWWKRRQPVHHHKQTGETQGDPSCTTYCRGLVCATVWNIVWATVGIWMYLAEFDEECRQEPIAIVILAWAIYQVGHSLCRLFVYLFFVDHIMFPSIGMKHNNSSSKWIIN